MGKDWLVLSFGAQSPIREGCDESSVPLLLFFLDFLSLCLFFFFFWEWNGGRGVFLPRSSLFRLDAQSRIIVLLAGAKATSYSHQTKGNLKDVPLSSKVHEAIEDAPTPPSAVLDEALLLTIVAEPRHV